jgi:hypothetical protein
VGDQVGGIRELAPEAADDVAVGLAEGMGDPVVAIGGEHLREPLRHLQARVRKLDRVEGDRLLDLRDLESEPLVTRPPDLLDLLAGGLLVLEPPTPMFAPARRRCHQPTLPPQPPISRVRDRTR